jgi:hypothetical protein
VSCILSGIFLCLMTLTRFDQAVFALAFPFLAFLIYRVLGLDTGKSVRSGALILISFFAFYSPWGIRNIRSFGAFFASNNSITALSTEPGILHLFFWKSGTTVSTIFQTPGLWLSQRITYFLRNVRDLLRSSRYLLLLVPILMEGFYKKLSRNELVFSVITVAFIGASLFTVSLTDYQESRYFCLSVLMLFILFFMIATGPILEKYSKARAPVLVIAMGYIPFVGAPGVRDAFQGVLSNGLQVVPQSTKSAESYYSRMHSDLMRAAAQANPPIPNPIVAINYADVFTYYTGLRSVYPLRNANSWDENMKAWAEKWKPDFIIAPQEWVASHGLDRALVAKSVDDLEILDVRRVRTLDSGS